MNTDAPDYPALLLETRKLLQREREHTEQARQRAEASERWLRTAARYLDTSEGRVKAAEDRANVATFWAIRSDVRIRELTRQSSKAEVDFRAKLNASVIPYELELGRLHRHIHAIESQNTHLAARLNAIETSVSWRASAPLRLASAKVPRRLKIIVERVARPFYHLALKLIRIVRKTEAQAGRPVSSNVNADVNSEVRLSTDIAVPQDHLPTWAMTPVAQPALVSIYAGLLLDNNQVDSAEQS